MEIIWRKSVDTAQKSALTLEDLRSLKMIRLKIHLSKLREILQTVCMWWAAQPYPQVPYKRL